MKVVGIDPGIAVTGYGIVERSGPRPVAVALGTITTPAAAPQSRRLAHLRDGLGRVLDEHRPDEAAIERVFFNANVRTAMAVGQASGVALLCAADAGLEIAQYTPLEVKSAVVGVGNATKAQVQAMVAALLGLQAAPRSADAADACALALCHLNRSGMARALARKGVGGVPAG